MTHATTRLAAWVVGVAVAGCAANAPPPPRSLYDRIGGLPTIDAMVDAGIHDGDMVVIERCETAENGTIVVALIDNSEVTLKRLRRKGDSPEMLGQYVCSLLLSPISETEVIL